MEGDHRTVQAIVADFVDEAVGLQLYARALAAAAAPVLADSGPELRSVEAEIWSAIGRARLKLGQSREAAAACAEAFRPYSPVLSALSGTCYWWGWVPTCGLTAPPPLTAAEPAKKASPIFGHNCGSNPLRLFNSSRLAINPPRDLSRY